MPETHVRRNFRTVRNQYGVILDRFGNESDRAVAILAVCLLDDQLKEVIRAFYVKDPEVESLFKDDHMLQTFNSKVNIAYFSGLIPKSLHHDLRLVGKIRNKFAHALDADLQFGHPSIARLIRESAVGNFALDDLSAPRSRFTFIVATMTGILPLVEQLVSIGMPLHLLRAFWEQRETSCYLRRRKCVPFSRKLLRLRNQRHDCT